MIQVLWGYIWVKSYDLNILNANRVSAFIQESLIRRKAQYSPSFYRICIGFFCASIRIPHGRSPPLFKVYQKEKRVNGGRK